MNQQLSAAAEQKDVHRPMSQTTPVDFTARHYFNYVVVLVNNVELFFGGWQWTCVPIES